MLINITIAIIVVVSSLIITSDGNNSQDLVYECTSTDVLDSKKKLPAQLGVYGPCVLSIKLSETQVCRSDVIVTVRN